MRIMIVVLILIFSFSVTAQTVLPGSYLNHSQQQSLANNSPFNDSAGNKKWLVSKYIGISSGMVFFNGSIATVQSVPIGIQINRRLNNNWYAFAGVSVAPSYSNFNHSFLSANTNKFLQNNYMFRSNQLDIYSRAEMGLMYMNEQKTFSISGSISIERSGYPLVPINQAGMARPNTFIAPNKGGIQ